MVYLSLESTGKSTALRIRSLTGLLCGDEVVGVEELICGKIYDAVGGLGGVQRRNG